MLPYIPSACNKFSPSSGLMFEETQCGENLSTKVVLLLHAILEPFALLEGRLDFCTEWTWFFYTPNWISSKLVPWERVTLPHAGFSFGNSYEAFAVLR